MKIRQEISSMIFKEMKNFQPIDYLAHLPIPKLSNSLLVDNELARISAGKKTRRLNEDRYMVVGPKKNQINITSKWKKCIENVQVRLAEEQNIILNLQIQKEWALKSWKIHHRQL